MSLQSYIQKQVCWVKSLRRHLDLPDNETAMMVWANDGYAERFAKKFRKEIRN